MKHLHIWCVNKDIIPFKTLTKILDKADDTEPHYTDGSTCIQEAENETCEVQRDRVVTSIGMPERYNAYIYVHIFIVNIYILMF
jgi:hypothetical protein